MNDTTINGVFVPKDMLIMIPVLYLHMNPDVWPEPEKFDPERYIIIYYGTVKECKGCRMYFVH